VVFEIESRGIRRRSLSVGYMCDRSNSTYLMYSFAQTSHHRSTHGGHPQGRAGDSIRPLDKDALRGLSHRCLESMVDQKRLRSSTLNLAHRNDEMGQEGGYHRYIQHSSSDASFSPPSSSTQAVTPVDLITIISSRL
jgi:hypothetical protein